MPRKARELAAIEVSRLKTPGLKAVGGVDGLYLQVTASAARTWILRYSLSGKRRDMGLGGFPDVPLADARRLARDAKELIDKGVDPIHARQEGRRTHAAEQSTLKTFDECVTAFIADKESEWRNPKHRQQWENTLKTYATPVMGALLVRDIALPHVMDVLKPIWLTKNETASRVRGRIEKVLDWATVRGYREGLNPARWKGHLDSLLPSPGKVQEVAHHKAIDLNSIAGFTSSLRQVGGMGARALEFAILTAARSGEVRGATWVEIDLEGKVWTVPAGRMKAGREHRVPLSPQAVRLLKALPRTDGQELLFPAPRGGQLSDMTLSAVMRRMEVDSTVHGFRSSFRDWAAERTSYAHQLAEMALAHTIENKAEAAYRRGDMLEKRREMMADWAAFCDAPPVTEAPAATAE